MASSPKRVNHPQDSKAGPFQDERLARLWRPAPLWALGVVGLAAVFATWQWWRGGDALPKRWMHENVSFSPCFDNLTGHPSRNKACFRDRKDEDARIPARYLDWIEPHVAVYSTAAPQPAPPTLRDLGERGQAEAIAFVEKGAAPKGKAWDALQEALDGVKTAVGEHDPFRFDRVLVANVAKGVYWAPGDRMVWTRVLIQPINFEFAGYSVAETDNEALKVTSVERTDSKKFSADLSATIPGMDGPKADVGPSRERSVKTNTDINAQYEKLGVDIMPRFLRIVRESETGGDAVGNTKISLTALTDPDTIRRRYPGEQVQHPSGDDPIVLLVTKTHFDEDGDRPVDDKTKPDAKPAIDILPQTPVPHCALRARVWMLYEERQVDAGRESYDEAKQSVTMIHDAEDKQDVEIMSADEVSPAAWSLRLCESSQCADKELHYLEASVLPTPPAPAAVSPWRKVVFTDYGVAMRLAHSLRTHPATVLNGDYNFNFPREGDRTYMTLVPEKAKDDECNPEPLMEVSGR
jgi:hypothetical protein